MMDNEILPTQHEMDQLQQHQHRQQALSNVFHSGSINIGHGTKSRAGLGATEAERYLQAAGSDCKHTHVNGSKKFSTVNDAESYIDTLSVAWNLNSNKMNRIFIAEIKAQCQLVGSGECDHWHNEFTQGAQRGSGKYVLVHIMVTDSRSIRVSYTQHEISLTLGNSQTYSTCAEAAMKDWLKLKAMENLREMVAERELPSIIYE
ncbi:unnamed protein product [Rotaria sp. Silwood2]|nr:unnamed protein product [Rotaria sp. Silwood2]CAF4365780.1 unnamed protein product [Rotaria sp. Silwood2]